MLKHLLQKIIPCIVFFTGCGKVYCQYDTVLKAHGPVDSVKSKAYEDLSLKDLLNVKIVSVSKESELLFDAPLSASVVTKEDIRRTGCTSIMEALRLVPGMIVREQSNGNYDIHLRGMDNVPPNSPFHVTANNTTLVMIDDRPVYSYLLGGTFWETLPVDINDVEKIEVVRGPAAALYGPNAMNGVINIITRKVEKEGLYFVANTQQGSYHTVINNASVGYRFNKKWNMIASGNYQERQRTQTSYYEFNRNQWLDNPDYFITILGDTAQNGFFNNPNPSLAMEKYAGNLFINFEPEEKVRFNLSGGTQYSFVQKVSTENLITPLSNITSGSRYIDFRANVHGLSAQLSYNGGTQNTDYDLGKKYDLNTIAGNMEYKFTKGNFSITPGIGYTSALADDRKYSDLINKRVFLNGRGQITTKRASVHSEYRLIPNKLRLVAGLEANKFNFPDSTYISYEFAVTYKPVKEHLFRAVYSRSPRSANIFDTYIDQTLSYNPIGYRNFLKTTLEGNKNPLLLTAGMFEIGYRGKFGKRIAVDIEIFNINSVNYNIPVYNKPYIQFNGNDTILVLPVRATNIPLKLNQQGITASFTYSSKQWQVKPFVTLQRSRIKDYAPYINTPDAGTPEAAQKNIYSGIGSVSTLKSTPTLFGGASVNYLFNPKFNINISAYYYSAQTYYHLTNLLFNDGSRGIEHFNPKLILNAKVSYRAVKGLQIFCSGKNILDDRSGEFFRTDAVPFMLFGGINYEL